MTSVFWWTLGLLILGALFVPGGIGLLFKGAFGAFRNPVLWRGLLVAGGTMMILVGILVPTAVVDGLDKHYPGESAIAYAFYNAHEREELKSVAEAERTVKSMRVRFYIDCPRPEQWDAVSADKQRVWHKYYQAKGAPQFPFPLPPEACYLTASREWAQR